MKNKAEIVSVVTSQVTDSNSSHSSRLYLTWLDLVFNPIDLTWLELRTQMTWLDSDSNFKWLDLTQTRSVYYSSQKTDSSQKKRLEWKEKTRVKRKDSSQKKRRESKRTSLFFALPLVPCINLALFIKTAHVGLYTGIGWSGSPNY